MDQLTDAWAFVMTHLDRVGPEPSVRITPVWTPERRFEVVVEGMQEETE